MLTGDLTPRPHSDVVNKSSSWFFTDQPGPGNRSYGFLREKDTMFHAAANPTITPWQRLANERLEVANKLARICAILVAVMVALGLNTFSAMSEQSKMCSSLLEVHSSMDQYTAKKLPTNKIVKKFCS
jgi:hypothetical protein